MRPILLCLFALCGALSPAQQTKLGPVRFVAPEAEFVSWSPDGKGLAYSIVEQGGETKAIGLYDLSAAKGQQVLQIGPNQKVTSQEWLYGRTAMLVTLSEDIPGGSKPSVLLSVWALDATSFDARKLWSQEFLKEQEPTLEVDVSPVLPHALVTLQAAKTTSYYVVVQGAGGMVFSRDVTTAVGQGSGFAGWSVDGTALFSTLASSDQFSAKISRALGNAVQDRLKSDEGQGVVFVLGDGRGDSGNRASVPIKLTLDSSSFKFIRIQPSIPMGSSVLECVPSNGALRTVRFRGYHESKDNPPLSEKSLFSPGELKFSNSIAGTQSLWLTPNVKNPTSGTLVAAQAERYWMAPNGQQVAYTYSGVLFVRSIQQ